MAHKRPIAIITGAAGGMGQACARLFGRRYDLMLNDVNAPRLEAFAGTLRDEGYTVAGSTAADLSAAGPAEALASAAREAGPLGALIHTAGLSPALADWQSILRANLVGTERLLTSLEEALEPGFVAVLIASMAGHMAPAHTELDEILARPLDQSLLERAEPILQTMVRPGELYGLAQPAYGQSKRAVIRICERRGPEWGRRGARIVSISPGLIWTPMGRTEADKNQAAAALIEATPVGRWGTAADIANAAEFLVSDLAGFITGCDLRVDGGVTPSMGGVMF
jgi:NAD(P)-dependent dehydrogenase (short-subunit alcohol dehydrogenase family)